MGMFSDFNSRNTAVLPEELDLSVLEFVKLGDLEGQEFKLGGFFFSHGKYGEGVSIYAKTQDYQGGVKINLPKRYVDTFKNILNTKGAKEAILNGHVLITNIKSYEGKNGRTVGFDFKDC